MIAFDRLRGGCKFFGTRRRGGRGGIVSAMRTEMIFRGGARDREGLDDLRVSASPRETRDCPALEARNR